MSRLGLGLRPRLLGALLLTAIVTLTAAALALLGPLETRLRHDATSNLITAALGAKPNFEDAAASHGQLMPRKLDHILHDLGRRAVARVALVDATGRVIADTDPEVANSLDDAQRALRTDKTVHDVKFGRLRVATPLRIHGRRYALLLRKRLTDVAAANRVVTDAVITAGAVGLFIALLLGIGLTTTLLRRLRRLRDAARRLEAVGLDAPAPIDHSRDEVGDLARTFAAMQSRLRRQEASRRTFVATASHELRTPLASLEGMLELLRDDLSSDPVDIEDARERVARAQEQSQRLAQLASDLLDLSRLDAAVDLRSEPVEVTEVSRAVIAEFDRRAAEQGAEVDLTSSGDSYWATGDPGSVARIARILIDNAVRASPVGGSVRITVTGDGEYVSLAVEDDGPGIPPEERELIFERFRRGKAAPGKGFGLGLAIGRELAQRMGGSLELAGSGPGARFVLRLRAAPVAAAVGVE
ncbi:MAG TPA: HAMP domain-containing sensor histidine kinase [Solirubrobacteraceae bacterium]|jgi:signal transduction histidine kinase|nr:HAMP domain-containing sensor histidine kinase [Solirubrobacteraceae bacterium]